jgi:hypothetical protein
VETGQIHARFWHQGSQHEFSTTKNILRDGEPSDSVQGSIYHIEDAAPVTSSLLSRVSPFNELNETLKKSG